MWLLITLLIIIALVGLGAFLLSVPLSFAETEYDEEHEDFESEPNRVGAPGHYENRK